MQTPERESAEAEHQHHRYVGYQIPWFVHLLWVSFWLFAAYYILSFLVPAVQKEFLAPP